MAVSLRNWSSNAPLSPDQTDLVLHLQNLVDQQKPKVEKHRNTSLFFDSLQRPLAVEGSQASFKCQSVAHIRRREYREALGSKAESLSRMLSHIETICDVVGKVRTGYTGLSQRTDEIRKDCQCLLKQKKQLHHSADKLRNVLRHFDEVDAVTMQLNDKTAGIQSITASEFVQMLSRLDTSLNFFHQHSDFREAPRYLHIFEQLHSKAITSVLNHFNSALLFASEQAAESNKQSTDVFNMNFGTASRTVIEFRAVASSLRKLITLVEQKAVDSSEYSDLLAQCRQSYHKLRQNLLFSEVEANITQLLSIQDIIDLARRTSLYFTRVCSLEFQLLHEFFTQSDITIELFRQLLDPLCGLLYRHLRPLVLLQADAEILADLVTVLQVEILDEQVEARGQSVAPFKLVLMRIIEDSQERLVYRVKLFVRDRILSYVPSREDLQYPDKLTINSSIIDNNISNSSSMASSSAPVLVDKYKSWYPTLDATLRCLGRVFRALEPKVFESIAQRAVASCTHSLLEASRAICVRTSYVDGKLFLIKHLLILREQISPFNVNFAYSERTLEFTHLKTAFVDTIRGQASLMKFINSSSPCIVENIVDKQKEMEWELKHACEEFIGFETTQIVGSLVTFLNRVSDVNSAEHSSTLQMLLSQPSDCKDIVINMLNELSTRLATDMDTLGRKLHDYLDNVVTERLLMAPIKGNIKQSLDQLVVFMDTRFYEFHNDVISHLPIMEECSDN